MTTTLRARLTTYTDVLARPVDEPHSIDRREVVRRLRGLLGAEPDQERESRYE